MFWLGNVSQGSTVFQSLSLDIVGIVAILGEGSILRNAQASALSWHHVLPRLIPAPQALIKHERDKRLPSEIGTVVGTYSGNVRFELNFFCRLIHAAEEPLGRNEVRMVELHKKPDKLHDEAYGVKPYGVLHALSLLGFFISMSLVGLAIHYQDGFGLMATVLLSSTSSIVGLASWWSLTCEEEKPRNNNTTIPNSDVVIYYKDKGSFRIVRCDEEAIARLYFRAEECNPVLSDHWYRAFALVATGTLIFGLICLSNSHKILQLAFAAAYVVLNTLYWASSCLPPLKHHWTHNYETVPVRVITPQESLSERSSTPATQQELNGASVLHNLERVKSPEVMSPEVMSPEVMSPSMTRQPTLESGKRLRPAPRRGSSFLKIPGMPRLTRGLSKDVTRPDKYTMRFTDALWIAIALTGTTRWLRMTHIVPDTVAWEKWVEEAGIVAESGWDPVNHRVIQRRLTKDGKVVSGTEEDTQVMVSATKANPASAFWALLRGAKPESQDERWERHKKVNLPPWDYQGRLKDLLSQHQKKRPKWPSPNMLKLAGVSIQTDPRKVRPYAKKWRERAVKHGRPLVGDEAIDEEDEKEETAERVAGTTDVPATTAASSDGGLETEVADRPSVTFADTEEGHPPPVSSG